MNCILTHSGWRELVICDGTEIMMRLFPALGF